MDLGIAGEVGLVLGGSKGLGFACARALSEAGVRIAINGRDAKDGSAAAEKLGKGTMFVQGDLAERGQPGAMIDAVRNKLGPIRILVTNAGGPPPGQFHEHAIEVWRRASTSTCCRPWRRCSTCCRTCGGRGSAASSTSPRSS